jgi:putative molybdopterin biosynthesis protein
MVPVVRRPRVAILSTGDELLPPGSNMRLGMVFDSNATILADAVRELGGEPVQCGIVPDERAALERAIRRALACDVVLLSGGTSKGAGDLSYRVVGQLGPPGIIAHGVALKPGKPLCLAAVQEGGRTVPVVILPGFPTSAIFTFHEFVVPVIRSLAGRREDQNEVVQARLPARVNSERGRTEYLLVNLVQAPPAAGSSPASGLVAYPMGKGSGSVTAFSRADGFVVIPRQREYLEAGATVGVHLLSKGVQPADLIVIGSHCLGLDYLLGRLQERGLRSKFLAVGSTGGLEAAKRGECDLAGVHLLDPKTNVYNQPFLSDDLVLIPGYGRLQGIIFRKGDQRFEGKNVPEAVAFALADRDCVLVNRNRGSGTRVLIDRLLGEARPPGFLTEARSHNAVAAAIAQGRADWGLAIDAVARQPGLGFLPYQEERYDFVVPRSRLDRPVLRVFQELLSSAECRQALAALGCRT